MANTLSAAEARTLLEQGNARYVAGACEHPNAGTGRRDELVSGQGPFAVVLTCADSRVSPELAFDRGLGDLFVIRVAGNINSPEVQGSIEYAVKHLNTNLVVVLGHQSCGAVGAAVDGGAHGNAIDSLVKAIAPAVAVARELDGDLLDNSVRTNARLVAEELAGAEPDLSALVAERGVQVLPAYYSLVTGEVSFL